MRIDEHLLDDIALSSEDKNNPSLPKSESRTVPKLLSAIA